jgi:hypothetical protein
MTMMLLWQVMLAFAQRQGPAFIIALYLPLLLRCLLLLRTLLLQQHCRRCQPPHHCWLHCAAWPAARGYHRLDLHASSPCYEIAGQHICMPCHAINTPRLVSADLNVTPLLHCLVMTHVVTCTSMRLFAGEPPGRASKGLLKWDYTLN